MIIHCSAIAHTTKAILSSKLGLLDLRQRTKTLHVMLCLYRLSDLAFTCCLQDLKTCMQILLKTLYADYHDGFTLVSNYASAAYILSNHLLKFQKFQMSYLKSCFYLKSVKSHQVFLSQKCWKSSSLHPPPLSKVCVGSFGGELLHTTVFRVVWCVGAYRKSRSCYNDVVTVVSLVVADVTITRCSYHSDVIIICSDVIW
jgi:hypothetical protein